MSQNAMPQNANSPRSQKTPAPTSPPVAAQPSSSPRSISRHPAGGNAPTDLGFSAPDYSANPIARTLAARADALMDEVFAEVEQMVERGVRSQPTASPSTQTKVKEQSVSVATKAAESPKSLAESSLAVLQKLSPRQLAKGEAESLVDLDTNGLEEDLFVEAVQTPASTPQEDGSLFDKLLVAIVLTSLAVAGGIWFFFRSGMAPVSPPVAKAPNVNPEDAAFLDYVQRSLDRIDRAAEEAKVAASSAPTATPNPAPTTVLERIYIPLYQPPTAGGPPTIPTTPPRVATAPSASRPSAAPAPVAPAPAAPAPPETAAVVPNIAPSPTHVLIGLLELGDRSAALFEIDGATQRIQIGERIGSSGWTLVSISNQEAIVRRNGEVRSIYIGQEF